MRKFTLGDSACEVAPGSAGAVLHYVSDAEPGIERRRRGKAFHYVGPGGAAVCDEATLARIHSMVIIP
jgi:DNA topoisomerase-1